MEMSIREAKAKFSQAIAAAERGESVIVTKFGRPVAQISPPPAKKRGFDFEAAARVRAELGLENISVELPDYFDDPAYSRKVLGLEE